MMSQRDYGHGLARMSPYSRPMQPRQGGLNGGTNGSSSSTTAPSMPRPAGSSKIDPSFKSKRYRDKLREQIKALENLLPIDKASLHRKLDSQTVFRLVISYFRTKIFFQAAGLSKLPPPSDLPISSENEEDISPINTPIHSIDIKPPILPDAPTLDPKEIDDSLEARLSLEALDGFVLVVTSDGTILYSTENISSHLGFHQVDLVHRCLYGIVHPDDHHELKVVLEQTLPVALVSQSMGDPAYSESSETRSSDSQRVSFLCRMKCFNGTNTGFVKMHCCGIMHSFPGVVKSTRTSCQVLLAIFRPFSVLTLDTDMDFKQNVFWSKHDMDLRFKVLDARAHDVLGYESGDVEGQSLYDKIHPDDLAAVFTCHKTLIDLDEIYTLYLRIQKKDGSWMWLHSRAKVIIKNSRKHTIVFTHCPVREEDSSYLQQEARARNRYGLEEYFKLLLHGKTVSDSDQSTSQDSAPKRRWTSNDTYVVASQSPYKLKDDYSVSLHSPHGACPSSYHQSSERHSPVYPSTYAPHRYQKAAQGSMHQEEKIADEVPSVTVSYYDFTHRSESIGNPVHPQPQPHPALSMYQMVAHLPPEMYDADSYRKHAYRIMEANQGLGPAQSLPHYQLPLTPQTSPHSYYQQSQYQSQYSEHMVATPATAPMSPPPSPGSYKSATSCMYTGEMEEANKPIMHPMSQLECCMPPKSEYYASYVVNGALQVKLVGGSPPTTHGIGYPRDFLHEQYSPLTDCMYTQCRLESEQEMKPFQITNPYRKLPSQCAGPCLEDRITSTQQENGYPSNADFANHDPDRGVLPCPMANTKNGCLASSTRLIPINGFVKEVDPSTLPPINSFLDFLNEELPAPIEN